MLELFAVNPERFVLEYSLMILSGKQRIRANVVVGLLVNGFENSRIGKSDDIFCQDVRQLFVMLSLIFLKQAQTIQAPKIRTD
jgi:hypothetical protein